MLSIIYLSDYRRRESWSGSTVGDFPVDYVNCVGGDYLNEPPSIILKWIDVTMERFYG